MSAKINSKHLKNRRKFLGWTQQELAEKIGVKKQSIYNWEVHSDSTDDKNCLANILPKNLDNLHKVLGCTREYLEGKSNDFRGTAEYTSLGLEIKIIDSHIDPKKLMKDQIDKLSEDQISSSYKILCSIEKLNPDQIRFIGFLCESLLSYQITVSDKGILFPDLETFKRVFENSRNMLLGMYLEILKSPLKTNVILIDAIYAYVSRGLTRDYNYLFSNLIKKLENPYQAFKNTFGCLEHINQTISRLHITQENLSPDKKREKDLILLYQSIYKETILPQVKKEISHLLGQPVEKIFPETPEHSNEL